MTDRPIEAFFYGLFMDVDITHRDLERLYSGPGLELYRPEVVVVETLDGESVPALCYNLPDAPLPDERNPEYAARLQALLRRLKFPPDYVASVG